MVTPVANMPSAARNSWAEKLGGWAWRGGFIGRLDCMNFHVLWSTTEGRSDMLQETIEPAWLDAFEAVLGRCALRPGDTVAVLSESQSRPVLPELAAPRRRPPGRQVFSLVLPSAFGAGTPVARSTGASPVLRQIAPVVSALAGSTLVVDCTVEGLMHAPELPAILKGGARVLYVSNEHPEALARLVPDDTLEPLVKEHVKRLRARGDAGDVARRHRPHHLAGRARCAAATGATPAGPAP